MTRAGARGLRHGVWIPAVLAIVVALGLAARTLGSLSSGSRGAPVPPAVVASALTAPRDAAAPSGAPSAAGPASAAALAPPPATQGRGGVAGDARDASDGGAAPRRLAPARSAAPAAPQDPELARKLYVAEADAARRAIGLGLVTPEQLDVAARASADPSGAASANSADGSSSGSAAARKTASDALLEEYLLRKEYQGVSFPQGFPAAKDMLGAVQSRMGNLSAQDRLTLLNDALKEMDSLPQQPRFESAPTLSTSPNG